MLSSIKQNYVMLYDILTLLKVECPNQRDGIKDTIADPDTVLF